MKKTMKYSVLRYSPSQVSGEHINLGIIFDAPQEGYREFRYLKKFSRLSSFDDELNIDNTKNLLQSIKIDVAGTIENYDSFDLDKYVEFFINDFSFERPKQITYEDLNEVVTALHKSYFRFEYDKKDRPSVDDDRKLLARIIQSSGKRFDRNIRLEGVFNEKITYDFVTDEYKVKVFDFNNKDLSRAMNSAKAWAWNGIHNTGKKLLIIYRYSDDQDKGDDTFKSIINILEKSGAEVRDFDSGIRLLQAV